MRRALVSSLVLALAAPAAAVPQLEDNSLSVEMVVDGLALPTTLAFIGADDFLILEKDVGRVRRVTNGVLSGTIALDLDVSSCGFDDERGLLGIAVHPNFASNKHVYLFYTASSEADDECDMFVEKTTRIERYTFDSATGTLGSATTIRELPSFVYYHNGGILDFGPDGKLYAVTGDNEQFGRTENDENAPVGFPGTSTIFRLNDDGTIPPDNPFDTDDDGMDGQDPVFAYGIRNSFGLGWDPVSDDLWDTENGPGSYDEVNRVTPGFNSGWRDLMGPDARDPDDQSGLVNLGAGSTYSDPEFSWLDPVSVTGIEFGGSGLGSYENDLFVGDFNNGDILHFELNPGRTSLALSGGLSDGVADSVAERDSRLFGSGFNGIADLENGPDGALYVSSIGDGAVYRISAEGGGPSEPENDLAITSVKPPKKVTFPHGSPPDSIKPIKVSVQNQGSDAQTIPDANKLAELFDVTLASLGGCPNPGFSWLPPKSGFPITLGPNAKLSLSLAVAWECVNDGAATTKDEDNSDYTLELRVNLGALGPTDEEPEDDTCPRAPSGDDKGCGKTPGGAAFRIDLVNK